MVSTKVDCGILVSSYIIFKVSQNVWQNYQLEKKNIIKDFPHQTIHTIVEKKSYKTIADLQLKLNTNVESAN